jgi:hypothetical protein
MRELCLSKASEDSVNKLLQFLQVSESKNCKYAWIDTICINKESSAELDESIRSMYGWYRDSHICIVQLSQTNYHFDMKRDAWFTRGWTLQELLAPKRISFFTKDWLQITHQDRDKAEDKQEFKRGGKDESSNLWTMISDITGIPIDDLLDFKPGLYDIGKRMNWVSKRSTTRIEDMAYCLIGIFRVNLSVSYGEKEGAFYRLQAEILQNSDDKSLFCWKGMASPYNSIFAASPECFAGVDLKDMQLSIYDPTSVLANFSLHMSLVLHQKSKLPESQARLLQNATMFAILGPSPQGKEHLILILEKTGANHQYKRLGVESLLIDEALNKKPNEITIK